LKEYKVIAGVLSSAGRQHVPCSRSVEMGKNPKIGFVLGSSSLMIGFGFCSGSRTLFTFGFGSVLGKTWALVRFVLAEFGFFPISSLGLRVRGPPIAGSVKAVIALVIVLTPTPTSPLRATHASCWPVSDRYRSHRVIIKRINIASFTCSV